MAFVPSSVSYLLYFICMLAKKSAIIFYSLSIGQDQQLALYITNSLYNNNSATSSGGAVYFSTWEHSHHNNVSVELENSKFFNNHAYIFGGLSFLITIITSSVHSIPSVAIAGLVVQPTLETSRVGLARRSTGHGPVRPYPK